MTKILFLLLSSSAWANTFVVDNLIDKGLTASQACVTDGSKQLASLPYSTSSVASSLVERDANQNAYTNNFISSVATVVSGGGNTTLNANSSRVEILTGTQAQTFKLPSAATFANTGATFEFNNNSTGLLTVNDGNNGLVTTVPSGGYARVINTDNGSPAGVWDKHFLIPANGSYGTSGMTITGTLNVTGTTTLATSLTGVTRAASGVISAAELSGDVTTSGSNVTTLKNTGIGAGSCTNCSITFDAQGRETTYSSGTAPVTSISVASANGFAGSSSGGATPALTLSTTVTGILQGNGTTISAVTIGSGLSFAGGTLSATGGGGCSQPILTKTTDYTILTADFTCANKIILVEMNCSTACAATLPAASNSGYEVKIINIGTAPATVSTAGSDTFGSSSDTTWTLIPGGSPQASNTFVANGGSRWDGF